MPSEEWNGFHISLPFDCNLGNRLDEMIWNVLLKKYIYISYLSIELPTEMLPKWYSNDYADNKLATFKSLTAFWLLTGLLIVTHGKCCTG